MHAERERQVEPGLAVSSARRTRGRARPGSRDRSMLRRRCCPCVPSCNTNIHASAAMTPPATMPATHRPATTRPRERRRRSSRRLRSHAAAAVPGPGTGSRAATRSAGTGRDPRCPGSSSKRSPHSGHWVMLWNDGIPSSSTRPVGNRTRSPQQSGVRQRMRASGLTKSLLRSGAATIPILARARAVYPAAYRCTVGVLGANGYNPASNSGIAENANVTHLSRALGGGPGGDPRGRRTHPATESPAEDAPARRRRPRAKRVGRGLHSGGRSRAARLPREPHRRGRQHPISASWSAAPPAHGRCWRRRRCARWATRTCPAWPAGSPTGSAAGRPFDVPRRLSDAQRRRYSRHILIPEVGEAGQLKLAGQQGTADRRGRARLACRALPRRGRRWHDRPGRRRRRRRVEPAAPDHPHHRPRRRAQGRVGQDGDQGADAGHRGQRPPVSGQPRTTSWT